MKIVDIFMKKGYFLFNWTDYMIRDEHLVGSYIISNIEELSKEIIKENEI